MEIFWILAVGGSLADMSCAITPLRTDNLKFPVFHIYQGWEQVSKAPPQPEVVFPPENIFNSFSRNKGFPFVWQNQVDATLKGSLYFKA